MNKLRDLAVSESGFIFDPFSGTTFSTNASGLVILEQLKQGATRTAIVAALEEAFDPRGPVDHHRDVDEFVGLLRRFELLPADFRLEER